MRASNIGLTKDGRLSNPVLEPQLLAFIRTSIPSIWALELLLLLRRAAPRYLTQEELVRMLRATPMLVDRLVAGLIAAGLVVQNEAGAYRFECVTPGTESMCEALALAADERPLALRDAIISTPNEKLRDLADAFRFNDGAKGPKGSTSK